MGVIFGLVPHTSDVVTAAALHRLAARLGEETGLEVTLRGFSSPMGLAIGLSEGAVDMAWTSPTLLFEESMRVVDPILSVVREGAAAYHAVLFVAADSPITRPEELAGRTVAWVAKTSAAGWMVPRVALARRGIDVRTCFRSELFLQSHASVAWAVKERRVDAGATYAVFEGGDSSRRLLKSGFGDFVPELAARVLLAAGPIPSDVIVAQRTIDPDVARARRRRRSLASPRIAMPISDAIMNADDFQPFTEAARAELRTLADEALALGG